MNEKPKASIGRIVIVKGLQSNCVDEYPATITRVWSEYVDKDMINTMVFPDAGMPTSVTSLYLYPTREAAEASGVRPVAFWPPRV